MRAGWGGVGLNYLIQRLHPNLLACFLKRTINRHPRHTSSRTLSRINTSEQTIARVWVRNISGNPPSQIPASNNYCVVHANTKIEETTLNASHDGPRQQHKYQAQAIGIHRHGLRGKQRHRPQEVEQYRKHYTTRYRDKDLTNLIKTPSQTRLG